MFNTQEGFLVLLFFSFYLLFAFFPLLVPSLIPILTISPDTLPPLTAPAEVSDNSLCLVQTEDLGKGKSD